MQSYIDRINIGIRSNNADFLNHIGLTLDDKGSQGFLASAFMLGYGISAWSHALLRRALRCSPKPALRPAAMGRRHGHLARLRQLWQPAGVAHPARGLRRALFSLASSYIKAHFEDRENGKPNAFVNMDTGLSLAIGFSLISLMLVHFQWQTSFYLLGLMNDGLGIRSFSPLPA